MSTKNLVLLPLLALFFSPLIHASTENNFFTRTTCLWLILFLGCFAGFFALYQFRVQKNLIGFFLAALGISASVFIMGTYPARPAALLIYSLGILFYLAVFTLRQDPRIKKTLPIVLIGFIALYAQWGIAQFIAQRDLGMFRIGESVLNGHTAGVASFWIGSTKLIRSYGPFAHANVFGGVLLIGTILLYMQRKSLIRTPLLEPLLFLLGLGIVVSFSRTAIIGLGILLIILLQERGRRVLLPCVLALLLLAPLVGLRSSDPHSVAGEDRLTGVIWFTDLVDMQTAVRGFGVGNYPAALSDYLTLQNIPHDPWDIAPIHSVPLLLFLELGILLFIPLGILIVYFLKNRDAWPLLVLIPALFFDHYFATQLAPLAFLVTAAGIVVQ